MRKYLKNTSASTLAASFILSVHHHRAAAWNAQRSVICAEWIGTRAPLMCAAISGCTIIPLFFALLVSSVACCAKTMTGHFQNCPPTTLSQRQGLGYHATVGRRSQAFTLVCSDDWSRIISTCFFSLSLTSSNVLFQ